MTMLRATLSCALILLSVVASAQEVDYVRDLDLTRDPSGRPSHQRYWVSLPLLPDIPDVANTSDPSSVKCVGDPLGPTTGDGLINVDDLICHWWTARHSGTGGGIFSVSYVRASECTPVSRTGAIALGQPRFTGTLFPLVPELGLDIIVAAPAGSGFSPQNDARVTGDNDDAWPGRVISYAPTCTGGQTTNCCGSLARRLDLIAVPHDAVAATADEILCGLAGVDWADMNGDGKPDTCWDDADGDRVRDPGEAPTGIFDGQTTITVHDVQQLPGQNPVFVSRHVMYRLGQLFFLGTNFPVETGDAVMVETQRGHQPTLWRPATN